MLTFKRDKFPAFGLQVRLHQPPAEEKKRLAGDTDVYVGIDVADGTVVACDSVHQALTLSLGIACHSPVDALVHANNKTAFIITRVS